MESYMVNYVCSTKGFLLLPFAPAVILINPLSTSLFGFAWSTVLLIFLILATTPCATDLNCVRIAQPTVTTSINIISIASTGGINKRTTYTGASGFSTGISKGALITVSGANDAEYNGSFYVTEVTSTTVVVRSFTNSSPETETNAIITSYINYNSLRDTLKAFTKAILIYYLVFLFFAIWGRLFLCKTQETSKGYLGGVAEGLNKKYIIPSSNYPSKTSSDTLNSDSYTKQEIEKIKQNELSKQDKMLQEARKQVEQAKLKARSLVYSNSNSTFTANKNNSNSKIENDGGILDTVTSFVDDATSFLEQVVTGNSSSKTSNRNDTMYNNTSNSYV